MKLLLSRLLALILLAAPATLHAQDAGDDSAAVTATVEAFMAAFDAKDAEAMGALLTDNAFLVSVRERDGGDQVQSMPMAQLIAGISAIPVDIAEPIDINAVLVDGPVATVWAPFAFYLDGNFSHCGIDIFTLIRADGNWKIATITYSHIEDDCEGAPTP